MPVAGHRPPATGACRSRARKDSDTAFEMLDLRIDGLFLVCGCNYVCYEVSIRLRTKMNLPGTAIAAWRAFGQAGAGQEPKRVGSGPDQGFARRNGARSAFCLAIPSQPCSTLTAQAGDGPDPTRVGSRPAPCFARRGGAASSAETQLLPAATQPLPGIFNFANRARSS